MASVSVTSATSTAATSSVPTIELFDIASLKTEAIAKRRARESPAQIENQRRLREAHANMVTAMGNKVRASIFDRLVADPLATSVVIFNPHDTADLKGFHHLTLVKGFYDKESRTYDRRVHHFAELLFDPIQELAGILAQCGITQIRDISDSEKSFNLVIEVTFRN